VPSVIFGQPFGPRAAASFMTQAVDQIARSTSFPFGAGCRAFSWSAYPMAMRSNPHARRTKVRSRDACARRGRRLRAGIRKEFLDRDDGKISVAPPGDLGLAENRRRSENVRSSTCPTLNRERAENDRDFPPPPPPVIDVGLP